TGATAIPSRSVDPPSTAERPRHGGRRAGGGRRGQPGWRATATSSRRQRKGPRQPSGATMTQRVLITAGAGGIGAAIARAFADDGAAVHVADIDAAAVDAVTTGPG